MTESTHAQLAANAARQLERNNQEIADIAERARGYQSELSDISSQRTRLQTQRDDMVKILAAANADRERAELAYDVAMNTPAELDKKQELADCEAVITAVQGDILAIDAQYVVTDGILEWTVREKALKGFVQDCYKERDQLLAKRAKLEELFNEAHEAHGKEVYQAAAAELAHQEAEVQQSRATLAEQEQALAELRASMPSKFAGWPVLANEVALAYQGSPDDPAARILRAADAYFATLEQEFSRLGFDLFRPNVFVGTYNLWSLLGADANEVRLMHFHTHQSPDDSRWPVASPTRRRALIAAALAEHTAGSKRTTPSELQRIETKLRELAAVGSE